MVVEPSEPEIRHVWVRGTSDHAPVRPGLVINWQHSPSHQITESAWDALVVVAPFPGAVLVEWVNAERIEPIRDPSLADGT